MAEYVAFHPDNETLGSAIQSALASIGNEQIQHIVERHGLKDVDPNKWYSQQTWLDLMRDIKERGYAMNLVAIGMKIPDTAKFPEMESVEAALSLLQVAYEYNHRGDDIGYYEYKSLGERKGKMICHNPFPSDLDYGIIYRLVQKFAPEDAENFVVERDDSIPNRTTGGDTCVYYIEW